MFLIITHLFNPLRTNTMFTEYKSLKKGTIIHAYHINKYDFISEEYEQDEDTPLRLKLKGTRMLKAEGHTPVFFTSKVKVSPGDYLIQTEEGIFHRYAHSFISIYGL